MKKRSEKICLRYLKIGYIKDRFEFAIQKRCKMCDLDESPKRPRKQIQTILIFQVTERILSCTLTDWPLETFETEQQAKEFKKKFKASRHYISSSKLIVQKITVSKQFQEDAWWNQQATTPPGFYIRPADDTVCEEVLYSLENPDVCINVQ